MVDPAAATFAYDDALVRRIRYDWPDHPETQALDLVVAGAIEVLLARPKLAGLVLLIEGGAEDGSDAGDPNANNDSLYERLSWMVRQSDRPVVGGLAGSVHGSTAALALLLDGLVMDPAASITHPRRTQPVAFVGGSTKRLTRTLGAARTKEFVLLGRPLQAREARKWGLVDRVSKGGEALDESIGLLRELAADPTEVTERRLLLAATQDGSA